MDLYFAAVSTRKHFREIFLDNEFFMLESFYYFKDWEHELINSDKCLDFMLDSGIFTFSYGKGGFDKINLDQYVDKYIAFINKNNVDKFFEMDLDALLPLGKIEEVREKIEKGTGKQCIPVWHWARGQHYWEKMCQEYKYIALGTDARRVKTNDIPLYNSMTRLAHKHNCKVHILGFSAPTEMRNVIADSCDSINWISGSVFHPKLFEFKEGKLTSKTIRKHLGMKHREVDTHNLYEWMKFATYLRKEKQNVYKEGLDMFL